MKGIVLAVTTVFIMAGCDAVFHRYMDVSGHEVTNQEVHSVVLDFARSAQYECEEIVLPTGANALECDRGIIVEITEKNKSHVVRVSTQTAFYEPASYTRFYKGLNHVLRVEFSDENVTVTNN